MYPQNSSYTLISTGFHPEHLLLVNNAIFGPILYSFAYKVHNSNMCPSLQILFGVNPHEYLQQIYNYHKQHAVI